MDILALLCAVFFLIVSGWSILSQCVNDGIVMKVGLIALNLASIGQLWNPQPRTMELMIVSLAVIWMAFMYRKAHGIKLWVPNKYFRGDIPCGQATQRWR